MSFYSNFWKKEKKITKTRNNISTILHSTTETQIKLLLLQLFFHVELRNEFGDGHVCEENVWNVLKLRRVS